MDYPRLVENIKRKKSFLCIGLDTDLQKIPEFLKRGTDPLFEFNRRIIDETSRYAVAYKPNLAFYESRGADGWQSLEKTVRYIRHNHPDIFLIADAKRGDIGNTSGMYAKAFFEQLEFDAITVAPYMGKDSVTPFLNYSGKWVILLALTSNEGASDFQFARDAKTNNPFYMNVLNTSVRWGSKDNMMYVVGATKADMLREIREVIPDHFILVPGVGAQGGSLEEVAQNGLNRNCGLLVNSSRGIIYAGKGSDFAKIAGVKSKELQEKMSAILTAKNLA
ncbi:MAG: orotidine-5'-phosphate decarboxylase [Bacteroidales bacterium]|nr:MAG: orotidine-5'-phosphate decarboxylase [Bacteroidales bacterium]